MFIGHFAPALVAAARPKAAGLGTLFVAAQLVDIGFAALLFPGLEAMRIVPGITAMNPMDLYHMPYTHSLLGALLWATGFGALVGVATKRRAAAIGAALVVLSHWFVDLLVHIPDLTLYGAPPKLGLGLWNHPMIAMPLEILFIGAALAHVFAKSRRLDLDHVSAKQRQLVGRERPRQNVGQVDDFHPLERPHGPFPLLGPHGSLRARY